MDQQFLSLADALALSNPPAVLARQVELRRQLEALHAKARSLLVGSPERNALADRIGEDAGQAIALSEELEG